MESCAANSLTPDFIDHKLITLHNRSSREFDYAKKRLLQKEIAAKYLIKQCLEEPLKTLVTLRANLRVSTSFLELNLLVLFSENGKRKKNPSSMQRKAGNCSDFVSPFAMSLFVLKKNYFQLVFF